MKKFVALPSASLISSASPVDCAEPPFVMEIFVAPVVTPRPICFALTPPVVAVAPDAFERF